MEIGHIFLSGIGNGYSEHFVRLVEGIEEQGLKQHVIVGSRELASRVRVCPNVTAGPPTNSALMAVALMPHVRLAHIHDEAAGQAGLLLKLTRSIPYVVTRRDRRPLGKSPIVRSIYARASSVIATTPEAAGALNAAGVAARVEVIADLDAASTARGAAEHIRLYRWAVDRSSVPAMLL